MDRVRLKTVFQTPEKIEFVQQSLGETVAKVFAIATSSSKLGRLSAASSPRFQSQRILGASRNFASFS
jgi:hypothetical protein